MKIAAKVQYLGLNYEGFQRQKNHPSIQGELERALSSLLDKAMTIHGAGRTDSGVSALGQVISFDSLRDIADLEDFRFHLNMLLPNDISIIAMKVVDDGFDARHSCVGKRYLYRFCIGEKHPLEYGTIAYLGKRFFDDKSFMDALKLFEGEHSFHNFTTKKEDVASFIRNVKPIQVESKDDTYEILFESNGFMTYQIRFMVGAALKAGFHKISLEEIKQRLDDPSRHILPHKAPAEGLILLEVLYESDVFA